MIIEMRKMSFVNKGAELMLLAVLQRMSEEYPSARFAMAPASDAPFEKRMELGLLQKASLWRYKTQWGCFADLAPKKLRSMYGVVTDREIDVVLDASGFAYSDQWGINSSVELASSSKRWKRHGTKLILLPQAFGPFTSEKIKKSIRVIVDNADLIFAREQTSYEYLVTTVGERPIIKIAPDFTNLISGIMPSGFDAKKNRFCIVPNYRMIDKTTAEISAAYLPFLCFCAEYLLKNDAKPFLLVHEGENDLMLAEKVNESVDGRLAIVKETNPLRVKGILGACDATIGSRFHGLVSALSQGVPSLATGWSHKYQKLFEDYDFKDGLVNHLEDVDEIRDKIDLLIDNASRAAIQMKLLERSTVMKQQVSEMWAEVFRIIGSTEAVGRR